MDNIHVLAAFFPAFSSMDNVGLRMLFLPALTYLCEILRVALASPFSRDMVDSLEILMIKLNEQLVKLEEMGMNCR